MNKKNNIKLIGTDIDGVWTDAKMYYTDQGDIMKVFSTYDGMAVEKLKSININTAILTSENSQIVLKRAEKLQIDHVYINVKNKLEKLKSICNKEGISLENVAYIGDDINDIEVLNSVGVSCITSNSPLKNKIIVDYETTRMGGDGAFREFVEYLFNDLFQ